jgi:hypothetical protein
VIVYLSVLLLASLFRNIHQFEVKSRITDIDFRMLDNNDFLPNKDPKIKVFLNPVIISLFGKTSNEKACSASK